MRNKILAAMMLTVFVMASALAQQEQQQKQPAPAKKPMGMMHGMMQGNMQGGMPGMMHGGMGGMMGGPMGIKNLSDEQRGKIQDLHLAHQKEMIPLQADMQKLRANLKIEITADKFNESKVKSIQGDIAKLFTEISTKMIQHQRAVREILTPEQRKQFDERILSAGPMGRGAKMGQGGMMGQGSKMGRGGMKGRGGMMGAKGGRGMGPGGTCNCNCMK